MLAPPPPLLTVREDLDLLLAPSSEKQIKGFAKERHQSLGQTFALPRLKKEKKEEINKKLEYLKISRISTATESEIREAP